MAFTSTVRSWWDFHRCSKGVVRPTGFFGRHTVWQQPELADAVTALEAGHINSGYVPSSDGYIGSRRDCPHGIAGATCQPSGSGCSLHNYVIAYDVEYNYNKHIRARAYPEDFKAWWFPAVCKYTLAQVRTIEGIKNTDGEQLWTWLGWAIGDFMHWQINVPSYRAVVDWNTVPTSKVVTEEDNDMMFVEYSDGFGVSGGDLKVRYWQALMAALGADIGADGVDGKYGNDTVAAVNELTGAVGRRIGPVEAAALHAMPSDHAHQPKTHTHPTVPKHDHAMPPHTHTHSHTGTVEVS